MLIVGKFNSLALVFLVIFLSSISGSIWNAWLMMEFNLMFFIYWLFHSSKNMIQFSESSILYFLVQSSSSLGIFWLVILDWSDLWLNWSLVSVFLFMKLGMFPFHPWVLAISGFLNHSSFYLLMFPQKIIPFLFFRFSVLSFILVVLNLMSSVIFSFLETSVYKMMIYSSMFNLSWLFFSYEISWGSASFFYLIYGVSLACLMCSMPTTMHSSYSSLLFTVGGWQSALLALSFLSLAGFPGTIGFWAKLTIMKSVINWSVMFSLLIMSLSLFMSYLYIRVFMPLIVSNMFLMMPLSYKANFYSFLMVLVLASPLFFIWGYNYTY